MKIAIGDAVFLLCAIGLILLGNVVLPITGTERILQDESNVSYLTAVGTFDRVELVDRHFGDFNGQEVEGASLAVVYNSGDSVLISTAHYKVSSFNRYYANGTNYPFYLYVYNQTEHLRERISVVGGTSEDFVYLNLTVTVSLSDVKVYIEQITYPGMFAAVSCYAIAFLIISLTCLIWASKHINKDI